MDLDLVKQVIKIAEESDITALAVEEGGMRIEVRREKYLGAPAVVSHIAPSSVPGGAAVEAVIEEEAGLVPITSPMVGTFYRSPSPESSPFVEIGESIDPGKVVCIIEAMKLFNEIESEISGTVAKILVENGQPVEYGQKLMLIKKK